MASVDSLTALFFDNPQYSDIVIKFGERQIYAHKVILAQQSGYFATAFFSRFQVASSPVIDLSDEDDSELLAGVIQYMYRDGPVDDVVRNLCSAPMDGLIDIYQLADKYDIPGLRADADSTLYLVMSDFPDLSLDNPSNHSFIDCVSRVCGPDAVQSADNTMKTTIIRLCQENCLSLFQNKSFLQRYTRGELFDVESATAFGLILGVRLLKSNNIAAEEADGFLETNSLTKNSRVVERNMINFFDDERFSDITVTYSGQKILAHKIVLATRSSYFQKVLKASPKISEIDLGSEHDSAAVTAFLEDFYSTGEIYSPPGISPLLFAEMCQLAKTYGSDSAAYTYKTRCHDALYRASFTDEYFSYVEALCGPNSSRYGDEAFLDTILRLVLDRVEHMDTRDFEVFKANLAEGSLFNAILLRRFTVEMLDDFRTERRKFTQINW